MKIFVLNKQNLFHNIHNLIFFQSGSSGERKRDPSFGGIADMFADNEDEDEHEEAEMTYSDVNHTKHKIFVFSLKIY